MKLFQMTHAFGQNIFELGEREQTTDRTHLWERDKATLTPGYCAVFLVTLIS